MKSLKKLTAIFAIMSLLMTVVVSAEEEKTIECIISPTDYATVVVTDVVAYSRAVPSPVASVVNTLFPDSSSNDLHSLYTSLIATYDLPLKDIISSMSAGFCIRSGGTNAAQSRVVPIFYDLKDFPVSKTPGVYERETNTDTSMLKYTSLYWPESGYSYKNAQLPLAYTIATLTSGLNVNYFDISSTALAAMKSSTSEYITLATGRPTSQYINTRYQMCKSEQLPTLKIEFNESDILYLANTTSESNMGELIVDFGKSGILDNSDSGYASYLELDTARQKLASEKLFEDLSEDGSDSIEGLLASYDSAVLYAQNAEAVPIEPSFNTNVEFIRNVYNKDGVDMPAVYGYVRFNEFNTVEKVSDCGMFVTKNSDTIKLAHGQDVAPGGAFAIRVFGDAITLEDTLTFTPYVGENLGTATDVTVSEPAL